MTTGAGELVAIRVVAKTAQAAERAAAEAQSFPTNGIEEREGEGGETELAIYVPAHEAEALRVALASALGPAGRVGGAETVEARDWSTAWREGLGPVSISPRLALRPSFASYQPAPGQHVLLVDPGQAFGTGHHASTRLALGLLDRALAARPGARVLDVGTGTGILVLAAAALGAREAVGFDIDPVAVREARANAESNGLADRVRLFAGTLAALGAREFDLVAANLLRRELLPLASNIAAHLALGGVAVLSGLLDEERPAVEASLSSVGLIVAEERSEREGAERWVALLATRGEPA